MEENSTNLNCRLCLKTPESSFKTLDTIQYNLKFILLYIDLTITNEPVICIACAEGVQDCLDFKSKCIDIENRISALVSNRINVKINLRDVYIREKANERTNDSGDSNVCRLCLEKAKCDSFTFLENEDKGMFSLYFPELDLDAVKQPVVCVSCRISLQRCFSFMKNSLQIEDEIIEYCRVEGKDSKGQVNLNNVAKFMSKEKLKMENGLYEIKMEEICVKEEDILPTSEEVKEVNCIDIVVPELDIKLESIKSLKIEPIDCDGHTNSKTQMHKCTQCTFETKYKNSLSRHRLKHQRADENALYQCHLCTYRTKMKFELRKHMVVHNNNLKVTMHKCTQCSFETKRLGNLHSHMIVHRSTSEITMHKCTNCDFETKRLKTLQRHMLVHKSISEIAMHKCTECSFETKRLETLHSHMIVHKSNSEVTMHKCTNCNFETKRLKSLQRQKIVHKSGTEVTMHKCTECSFETKRLRTLHSHMIVHKSNSEVTMYKCTDCDFETKRLKTLQRHQIVHKSCSEVTMHKCTVCDFQTKHKNCLRTHMRTHR